jgi:hypothetical protein
VVMRPRGQRHREELLGVETRHSAMRKLRLSSGLSRIRHLVNQVWSVHFLPYEKGRVRLTMSMSINSNNNRFLPRPITHPPKPTLWVFKGNVIGFYDIQSLLQIHTSAKCFLARACEHCAAQFGLGVVPFPEGAKLDGCFHWQAVHVFWAVDCYEENVFSWEGYNGVFDVWVWLFYP